MQLVFPGLPDITSKVEYSDSFKSVCVCVSVRVVGHTVWENGYSSKTLVKSFRITNVTSFIAVIYFIFTKITGRFQNPILS